MNTHGGDMGFSFSQHLDFKQGMSVKQMQHLMMSHQMQQSLRFLQMPHLELSQEVYQTLMENPLVEIDNDSLFDEADLALFCRLEREVKGKVDHLRNDNLMERYLPQKISLFQHLMNQAKCALPKEDLPLAEMIIGHIDERGFIQEADLPPNAESILKVIQTFDPVGVGARTLQECFLIQLKAFGKAGTPSYSVIANHFDLLLKNQWGKISKELGIEESDLRGQMEICMKRLQFSPTAHFAAQGETIIPDFTVIVAGCEVRLEFKGDDILPTFSLNQKYLAYLKKAIDKGERESILESLQTVRGLLRSLNERQKTLQALGKYLIDKQRDFFLEEGGQIVPETMKEAASCLGVHESTVARAAANKYLECSKGIFPLKYFFSTKYMTEQGEAVSSKAIEEALVGLIEGEDKMKPYSDEHLAGLLRESGFQVARRTIAKFRELLKIGNARQRKKG